MTVGELEPGTRKAGIIGLRVAVGFSLVALVVGVRPLNTAVQQMWAALHNWAGPLADRIGHQRHAGQPIHVPGDRSGWLASGHNWPAAVGIAIAVIAVWVWLAVAKVRRRDPFAEVQGRRNWAGIAAGIAVVLAGVVFGALQVDFGRTCVAGLLRGLAWLGRYMQQFTADLVSNRPSPLTGITGGGR